MLKTGTQDLRINPQFGPQHGVGYRQVNIGDRIVWTSTATTADSYVCCVYDISTTGVTSIANNVGSNRTMSVDFNTIESATTSYTFTTAGRHVIFFYFGGYIPSNAFSDINRLKEVYVKGMSGIYNQAFKNCTNLISINLNEVPFENNTGLGSSVFEGCTNLQHVGGLPEILVGGESNYSNLFKGCRSLTACTLPEGMMEVPAGMFQECKNLQVTIPSSVTTIQNDAFRDIRSYSVGDDGLVTIPPSIALTTIGDSSFRNSRVEFINPQGGGTLPFFRFWPNLQSVGASAFQGCKEVIFDNLVLSIPALVTSIGTLAFDGFIISDSLSGCEFLGTTPPACGEQCLGSYSESIHIPSGTLSAYQSAMPEYSTLFVER